MSTLQFYRDLQRPLRFWKRGDQLIQNSDMKEGIRSQYNYAPFESRDNRGLVTFAKSGS